MDPWKDPREPRKMYQSPVNILSPQGPTKPGEEDKTARDEVAGVAQQAALALPHAIF